MKLPEQYIADIARRGKLCLIVPSIDTTIDINENTQTFIGLKVVKASDHPDAVEYPDELFIKCKDDGKWFDIYVTLMSQQVMCLRQIGYRLAVGRESGDLMLSKAGFEYFKDVLCKHWNPARYPFPAFKTYARKFFENVEANTIRHAEKLRQKADEAMEAASRFSKASLSSN